MLNYILKLLSAAVSFWKILTSLLLLPAHPYYTTLTVDKADNSPFVGEGTISDSFACFNTS